MTENNFQIDSAAVSDRGLSKKRPQNEDSFLELNERGLFVVADGVGGAQAGDVASKMAVEVLSEAFTNFQKNIDAEETMKSAIERANKVIFQKAHDSPQFSTMATTIVALHIAGNIATIGHVGDSRLYRLDEQGDLHRETHDHSMVEEEVQAGRMTAEQAAGHPNKNVISRALGADYSVEVDMKTIMFEPNTIFMVCSDGITRHLNDPEIRELLLLNETPSDICQKMKEICYERGAEDNLTAVVTKVTGSISENTADFRPASQDGFEESTISTARPMQSDNLTVNNSLENTEAISAQNLQATTLKTTDLSETKITRQTPKAQDVDTQEVILPFNQENKSNEKVIVYPNTNKNAENLRQNEQKSKGGFIGKVLSALLFLLLGGGLGAAGYYFWMQNNKLAEVPPPQIQTQNFPFTTFEENRRLADQNPEQYVSNAAGKAETAEDFYLLGRAYLLTGKNLGALAAFGEAKNRLAQASDVNSAVLANEIAMSLAIINNSSAQREFDLNKANISQQPTGNPPNNSNSGVKNNLPINNQQF